MTWVLSILAVAAVFGLSAFVAARGSCEGCASHRSCGWFKEKGHGCDRP